VQHPILPFAPADLVGVLARMRSLLGQRGTMPAIDGARPMPRMVYTV